MKIFKYRFSKLIKILIFVGIALCIAGFGSNVYLILSNGVSKAANPVYPIIQYTLMFAISLFLLVLLISLLASSYYAIEDTTLKTSFGIIKSKYNINDVQTIILDRTTNKLSLFFKNEAFIVIVVKEEWYDEFTDMLCKVNPNIEFSIKSEESRKNNDDKKK